MVDKDKDGTEPYTSHLASNPWLDTVATEENCKGYLYLCNSYESVISK